jgi:hypothetical protein
VFFASKHFPESYDDPSPHDPKKALFAAFPEMKALSKQVNNVMEGA